MLCSLAEQRFGIVNCVSKIHNLSSLEYSTEQSFTSVSIGATSQRSPDIVRLEQGTVVRGINPLGCKTTEAGEAWGYPEFRFISYFSQDLSFSLSFSSNHIHPHTYSISPVQHGKVGWLRSGGHFNKIVYGPGAAVVVWKS